MPLLCYVPFCLKTLVYFALIYEMLEKIRICGHDGGMRRSIPSSAETLLQNEPNQWHSLAICDSEWPIPKFIEQYSLTCHRLEFDDTCSSFYGTPPNSHIIEDGLTWAKDKTQLMIACHAGISRSSAMALVIATEAWDMDKAFALLEKGSHYPNKLVVRIGASLIGKPELWDRFIKWMEEATGHHLYKRWTLEVDGFEI